MALLNIRILYSKEKLNPLNQLKQFNSNLLPQKETVRVSGFLEKSWCLAKQLKNKLPSQHGNAKLEKLHHKRITETNSAVLKEKSFLESFLDIIYLAMVPVAKNALTLSGSQTLHGSQKYLTTLNTQDRRVPGSKNAILFCFIIWFSGCTLWSKSKGC